MDGMQKELSKDHTALDEKAKDELWKPRGSVFAYESATANKRVRDTLYYR